MITNSAQLAASPASAFPVPAQAGGYPPALPAAFAAGSVTGGQGAGNDAGKLREVAQGFEAMLLRQMLSAAGKTDFGGDDLFGKSSDNTFKEMRDARFADLAAANGSLGLAAQIEAQLARTSAGDAANDAGNDAGPPPSGQSAAD